MSSHKFGMGEAIGVAGIIAGLVFALAGGIFAKASDAKPALVILVLGVLLALAIIACTYYRDAWPKWLLRTSVIATVTSLVAVFVYGGVVANSLYQVIKPPPPPPPTYGWNFWSPINGDFKLDRRDQQLAAVAVSNNELDVFAVGNDNQIWSTYWEAPSGWHGWYPLPHNDKFGAGTRRITAIARPEIQKIDVFAIGDDNHVWWTWWQGRAWSGWDSLPGDARFDPQTQAIAAVSRSQYNVDLFAIDLNGVVRTSFWDWRHRTWSNFYNIPAGPMTFPQAQNVSTVARNEHALDVFAIGTDGAVWRTNWEDGRTWAQWHEVPGKPGFDPASQQVAAVSRPMSNSLDILAIDGRNRVLSNHSGNGYDWQGWTEQLPLNIDFDHKTQRVTALARSRANIDVFALSSDGPSAADGRLWSAWWNNDKSAWGKWFEPDLGGAKFNVAQQNVAVAARTENNLDLFAIGLDGALWTAAWGIR